MDLVRSEIEHLKQELITRIAQAGTGIGAVTGAVAGGIIGHQSGHTAEGAVIGGLVGGAAGNAIGGSQDRRNAAYGQRYYIDSYGRRVYY